MKILNLNTHSLIEQDYEKKCDIFVKKILEIKPDFITMQEVNQSIFSPTQKFTPVTFKNCGKFPLRENNHALKIYNMLKNNDLEYNFTWCGFKVGYKKFQEGLAIFSLSSIDDAKSFYLSKSRNHFDWKVRKALVIKSDEISVATVHTGWWDDPDEPLKEQLDSLFDGLKNHENLILTGDFNSSDTEADKGYSYILKNGFFDTFTLAKAKDSGKTITDKIDGWQTTGEKRIDYVFTHKKTEVKSSFTVFDGLDRVSDHKGIIVTI